MRILAVGVAAFLWTVAGCAGTLMGGSSALDQIGPYPENYRQIFKAYIGRAFYDPPSLRDVAISAPVKGKLWSIPGWLVCLETNARDPHSGRYEGKVKRLYLLRNGAIADVLMKAPYCDSVVLAPWLDWATAASR